MQLSLFAALRHPVLCGLAQAECRIEPHSLSKPLVSNLAEPCSCHTFRFADVVTGVPEWRQQDSVATALIRQEAEGGQALIAALMQRCPKGALSNLGSTLQPACMALRVAKIRLFSCSILICCL